MCPLKMHAGSLVGEAHLGLSQSQRPQPSRDASKHFRAGRQEAALVYIDGGECPRPTCVFGAISNLHILRITSYPRRASAPIEEPGSSATIRPSLGNSDRLDCRRIDTPLYHLSGYLAVCCPSRRSSCKPRLLPKRSAEATPAPTHLSVTPWTQETALRIRQVSTGPLMALTGSKAMS